jgi:hypothetical protein
MVSISGSPTVLSFPIDLSPKMHLKNSFPVALAVASFNLSWSQKFLSFTDVYTTLLLPL